MNKHILFIAILTSMISCTSKLNYHIEGTALSCSDGRLVYLYNLNTESGIDTVAVKNGMFRFEGGLETNTIATISTTGSVIDFVLEEGKTVVSITDKLRIISGNKLNQTMMEYHRSTEKLATQANNVFEKMFVSNADSCWISLNSLKITKEYASRFAQLRQTIYNNNKQNIIGAYIYYDFIPFRSKAQINRFYEQNDYAKTFKRINRVIEENRNFGKLNNGKMYSDFTAKDMNNEQDIKLSNLIGNGSYTLLHICSTTSECPTRQQKIVRDISEKYSQQGLMVISMNILGNHEGAKTKTPPHKTNYIQLYDPTKYDFEALYGAYSLPYNIIFDPNGMIIETELKTEQIDDFISKIYAEKE